MSKAPRNQPCLATAAPMAKTPGRFHRFDAQAAFRIQNRSCKQSFLISKHTCWGGADDRNWKEKHSKQRETCDTDLHPQHRQQSMSLLRRQNCPPSAWMHERCHTWGQLFCWTKCLMWAPWLLFLKEASLTSDFHKNFWTATFFIHVRILRRASHLTAVSLKPECLKSFTWRWVSRRLGTPGGGLAAVAMGCPNVWAFEATKTSSRQAVFFRNLRGRKVTKEHKRCPNCWRSGDFAIWGCNNTSAWGRTKHSGQREFLRSSTMEPIRWSKSQNWLAVHRQY